MLWKKEKLFLFFFFWLINITDFCFSSIELFQDDPLICCRTCGEAIIPSKLFKQPPLPFFLNYFDKNTINSSHHPWPSGCRSSCQHVNKHTIGFILVDFVNIKIQFIKGFALSDRSEIWIVFAMLILTFNEKRVFGLCFVLLSFFPPKDVSKLSELFFPLFYGRRFDSDSISKEDDLY